MRFKYKRSEYKIDVDVYQYTLYKRLKDNTKGKEQWETYGHYNDIYYLLLKLMRIGLIDQKDYQDIRQMLRGSLQLLSNTMEKALPSPKEVDKFWDDQKEEAKRLQENAKVMRKAPDGKVKEAVDMAMEKYKGALDNLAKR